MASGEEAQARLIAAAERLFAIHGSEAVSLREITAEARVGNASAIQYHFEGRAGLVRAVLNKHEPAIEARRHALLDQYEGTRANDLRLLVGAFVRPLAAELGNPDGGPGYLQLWCDLITRPKPVLVLPSLDLPEDSTHRWRMMVEPLLDPEAVRLHRRFAAIRVCAYELARRGRVAPTRPYDRFTNELIEIILAILSIPGRREGDVVVELNAMSQTSPDVVPSTVAVGPQSPT